MTHTTKQRLLDEGTAMLLAHGYNDLGIQALLERTGVPKGSFYHHFKSKEDFALQVIDLYMVEVHEGLDLCLSDTSLSPLLRVRRFFELSRDKYEREGYLGCLLGGLGQELAGVSALFRGKVEACFTQITERIATGLAQARRQGELPAHTDPQMMADLLLSCWEGAALRCRLRRDPAPLDAILDFYFTAAASAAGSVES